MPTAMHLGTTTLPVRLSRVTTMNESFLAGWNDFQNGKPYDDTGYVAYEYRNGWRSAQVSVRC